MSTWEAVSGLVEFPDGRSIRGTGVRRPRGEVPAPDFAVYLLGSDPGIDGWPYRWVKWRDFSLPNSMDDAINALGEAHTRAERERVEIACGGGKGRTGTAMSLLAVMSGVEPDHAIAWVRENYCRDAAKIAHDTRPSLHKSARLDGGCKVAARPPGSAITRTGPGR